MVLQQERAEGRNQVCRAESSHLWTCCTLQYVARDGSSEKGQWKLPWADEHKPKDLLPLLVITTYPWLGLAYDLGTMILPKGVGKNLMKD